MDLLRDPIWQFLGVVVAVILFIVPISYKYLRRRAKNALGTEKTIPIRPTAIPVAQELKNSTLGQYEVLDTVSETPLSHVWRVRSFSNGDTFILKQNKHPMGYDPITIRKLKTLYQDGTGAKPRVALPIEIIKENDSLYEVLEAVEGWTLEELVRLNPNRTVYGQLLEDWAQELLDILVPLHSAGYVHRDVSPYNIIVARDTLDLILIDFSNTIHRKPNKKFSLIECPGFSAPELREGKYYPSSDLYSVGAVLTYLNTGRHPPTVEDRLYRGKEIGLHDIRGRKFAPAIHRMLLLEPKGRFLNADEAKAAIQRHGTTEIYDRSPEGVFLLGDGSRLMLRRQSWRRI